VLEKSGDGVIAIIYHAARELRRTELSFHNNNTGGGARAVIKNNKAGVGAADAAITCLLQLK
jgi:hypothetical protein